MPKLFLSVEGGDQEQDPNWIQIRRALFKERLSPESWISLSTDQGSYIRCKGPLDGLCIEWRDVRTNGSAIEHRINRCGQWWRSNQHMLTNTAAEPAIIQTPPDELLDLSDAILIFEHFFHHRQPPDAYSLPVLRIERQRKG